MNDHSDIDAKALQARRLVDRRSTAQRNQERIESAYMNAPTDPDSQSALIQQSWDEALERVLAKRNSPIND